ncbi:MAG: hypothetical protein HY962_06950 [Ignavibacteriae bacterium]|nr:hypothetical protein [Ignavibacteriota bacterium]
MKNIFRWRYILSLALFLLLCGSACAQQPDDVETYRLQHARIKAAVQRQALAALLLLRRLDSVGAETRAEQANILELVDMQREQLALRDDSARALAAAAAELARNAPAATRGSAAAALEAIHEDRRSIDTYLEYVSLFRKKFNTAPHGGTAVSGLPGPVQGQVRVGVGDASYTTSGPAAARQRTSSRALDATASMMLSERSTASMALRHTGTVMRTPYTSTDVRLGYAYRDGNDIYIDNSASIGVYSDEAFAQNEFTQYVMASTLQAGLGSGTRLAASAVLDGKSYHNTSGNNFGGLRAQSRVTFGEAQASVFAVGLDGGYQAGAAPSMRYSRLAPHAQYSMRQGNGALHLRAEGESVGYTGDAAINNYSREQLEAVWSQPALQRRLTVTAKQYAHNPAADYLRGESALRWDTRGAATSYTSASCAVTHYTRLSDFGSDFGDARFDHARNGETWAIDAHVYSRVWFNQRDTVPRDHVIDAVMSVSWTTPYGRIGPTAGAHVLLRPGVSVFARDGGSYRAGIQATSDFTVSIVRCTAMLRYEVTLAYNPELSIDQNTGITRIGILRDRYPTTLQYSVRASAPVLPALDLTLDVHHYTIHTDMDDQTSINPVTRRSQFSMLLGAQYRFGL